MYVASSIPSDACGGTYTYQLSVTYNGLTSSRSTTFTVSGPPPSITVNVPNGGESWQIGTSQAITWTSSNLTANVEIELSRDGGSTFKTLFSDITNDGSQSWTVTGPTTTQARVKITSLVNMTVSDTSNANFTISVNYVQRNGEPLPKSEN